ncbi:unnamed protein product [Paramecium sonneborni]|uniref:Calcium-transporting ATPase n=1 Tax=Paramecium sonneborni TaxID=65129 RepID=A0A8S1Q1J2_9CILI|nr:unnamed protein product [Paramecium sonneborni]
MFKVSKEQLQQILISGLFQDHQDSLNELNSTKLFEDSLKSNIQQGLSEDKAEQSQQVFGVNWNENQDSIGIFKAFRIVLFKPKSILFLTLSLIAMMLKYLSKDEIQTNEYIESLIIFILLFLNLMISGFQIKNENKKYIQNQNLKEQSKYANVLRNGQQQIILAKDLVVGDVIILQENDTLYVDGLIVEQNNLYIDECYITGESEFIHKITLEEAVESKQSIIPHKHLAFAGSKIAKGNGKLLVLAVGSQIQINKLSINLLQEEKKTFISKAIENISYKIDIIGFFGTKLLVLILLARQIFDSNEQNVNRYNTISNILNLIIVLKSGDTTKILATHFYLQLGQTVKAMLSEQNLVRNLQQLEHLPFMDSVIVDKTGTLTQNRIILDSFMNDTVDKLTSSQFNLYSQEFQQAFIDSCLINNNFDPETQEGSAIDKALFYCSQQLRVNLQERSQQVTHKISFTSVRKIQTIVINNNKVAIRGQAEHILNCSTKFYSLKNGIIAIDNVLKNNIEQYLQELSQKGRILGIAYRDIDLQNENIQELIENKKFEFDKQNLTLLGFLLFVDPLRFETKSAVQGFKQAGVKVVLVTGDNSNNAKHIAMEAGIMTSNSIVLEGNKFALKLQEKSENSQKEIEDIQVLCRARPEDKYNFVKELQEMGHVVGVCCNGLNDIPALSRADVGYSLGISGTEIDRQTSGIILLDDNFNSIYKGLFFGRNLIDSIKRQIQYQIISNFSLMIILIVSAILENVFISPLQFIWINLINDLFAILALSNCRPSSELKYQKPPNKTGFILDKNVLIHIIILSVYITTVCILFVNQSLMVFNLYVIITICNLINSRMVHLELNVFNGFFGSWILYTTILLIGIVQFFIVQYGGILMHTFPGLSFQQWCVCIVIGIGSIVWRNIVILFIKLINISNKDKQKVN